MFRVVKGVLKSSQVTEEPQDMPNHSLLTAENLSVSQFQRSPIRDIEVKKWLDESMYDQDFMSIEESRRSSYPSLDELISSSSEPDSFECDSDDETIVYPDLKDSMASTVRSSGQEPDTPCLLRDEELSKIFDMPDFGNEKYEECEDAFSMTFSPIAELMLEEHFNTPSSAPASSSAERMGLNRSLDCSSSSVPTHLDEEESVMYCTLSASASPSKHGAEEDVGFQESHYLGQVKQKLSQLDEMSLVEIVRLHELLPDLGLEMSQYEEFQRVTTFHLLNRFTPLVNAPYFFMDTEDPTLGPICQKDGWELLYDSRKSEDCVFDYHGQLWINVFTKELIITSAGTKYEIYHDSECSIPKSGYFKLLKDLISDAEILFQYTPSQYYQGARVFLRDCIQVLEEYMPDHGLRLSDFNLVTMGHSLGASHAELMHAELLASGKCNKFKDVLSYTIENPGSKTLIQNLLQEKYPSLSEQQIADISTKMIENCLTINGPINNINTVGESLGSVFTLSEQNLATIMQGLAPSGLLDVHYTKVVHSLSNYVSIDELQKALDWPKHLFWSKFGATLIGSVAGRAFSFYDYCKKHAEGIIPSGVLGIFSWIGDGSVEDLDPIGEALDSFYCDSD